MHAVGGAPAFMKNLREFWKPLLPIMAAGAVYTLATIALWQAPGGAMRGFLVWNLFLACLPLVFARLLEWRPPERSRPLSCWPLAPWLLFFPNAPYMATDLIHLGHLEFYEPGAGYAGSLRNWAVLAHLAAGVFFGLLAGCRSLDMVRAAVRQAFCRRAEIALLAVSIPLAGYAIYIGRFLRLNSWDVVRPWYLLQRLAEGMNGFAFAYSALMAALIAFTYAVYRLFLRNNALKETSS